MLLFLNTNSISHKNCTLYSAVSTACIVILSLRYLIEFLKIYLPVYNLMRGGALLMNSCILTLIIIGGLCIDMCVAAPLFTEERDSDVKSR